VSILQAKPSLGWISFAWMQTLGNIPSNNIISPKSSQGIQLWPQNKIDQNGA